MVKKKMKFLSLLKRNSSCHQRPKTLSFRANDNKNDAVFKITNSAYNTITTTDSFSAASDNDDGDDLIETVIRDLRSDRLFFEPDNTKSLSLQPDEKKSIVNGSFSIPFENSTAVVMDSENPYMDFRKSMEEMVDAQGIDDWNGLDELLSWYFECNEKRNYGFIVAAFFDLFASSSQPSTPSSSPLSFYSSSTMPSSCSTPYNGGLRLEQIKEEITRDGDDDDDEEE